MQDPFFNFLHVFELYHHLFIFRNGTRNNQKQNILCLHFYVRKVHKFYIYIMQMYKLITRNTKKINKNYGKELVLHSFFFRKKKPRFRLCLLPYTIYRDKNKKISPNPHGTKQGNIVLHKKQCTTSSYSAYILLWR